MIPKGGRDFLLFLIREVLTALSALCLAGGRRFPGAVECLDFMWHDL